MTRALVVSRPGQIDLASRLAAVAGPDEVLVHPLAVGVCHTDLDILDGRIDPDFVRYPIVLGHEWSGVVVASGDSSTAAAAYAPGDSVVVEGIVPCGRCRACMVGRTNRCETYDEFGFTRDGAAGDALVAPTRLVHRLSDAVSAESGALVEPASVVMTALLRAQPQPGQRVLVVGDGTIGLLAATLVRLWSPAEVTLLGRRPAQEVLAASARVDRFVQDAAAAGAQYDLVIEAAGAVDAVSAALAAPARGGSVVLLGFPGHGVSVPLRVDDVVNADLQVMGSFGYTSSAWIRVVDLLNSALFDLGFLVTHRFPLERWAEALQALRAPDDAAPRGKVLLEIG